MVPAVPLDEEVKECQNYKGDMELLANPEKLILEVGKIKGFAVRIKAFHFRLTYKGLAEDLASKTDILLSFWKNVRTDERIFAVFE